MSLATRIKTICLWIGIFLSFSSVSEEIIWEKNKNVFIKLVEHESSLYAHPMAISSEASHAFLSQVSVFNAKDKKDTPLFTSAQIELLSNYLPSAFAKAESNQVVVFALSKKKSALAGFSSREVFTAGSFFIQRDALTLKIGDLERERQKGYESVYDPTNLGLVRYKFDFGLDSASGASKQNILGLVSKVDGFNSSQSNEVSVTVASLPSLPQQINIQNASQKQNKSNTVGLTRHEVEQIINEREAASNKETEEIATQLEIKSTTQKTPNTSTKSLEERFKILQNLKSQGLISEEEYQAKRAELIAEI